jgi:hypothetical protein
MEEDSFEGQGRIGIQVESTTVSVAPGGSVSIPLVLTNRGLVEDRLQLSVEGIPASWISTPSPVTQLAPGQEQGVPITISPPRSTQSRAGRHVLTIKVRSQEAPDQVVGVECILTVGAFDQFQSDLRPQRVEAGEPARLTVENQGNTGQAYRVTWQSLQDELVFEPGETQELRVAEGEATMLEFSASPRQRPFFGGERSYAYTARVQSPAGDAQNLSGEVVSRALIPTWVLPVVLVLIVAACAVVALLVLPGGDQDLQPTETAVAQVTDTVEAPAPTDAPTEVPPTEVPPTEPPPEPTDEPPLEPTDEPPPEPTEGPPVEPTDEDGDGSGPDIPCLPVAGVIFIVPLLVMRKRTD